MASFELAELKIEDTNLAGIGSDEDKALRKKAAETEEAWKGRGQEPGLDIWRIEQFKVVPWPKEQYGRFYEGDSYIVLHTTRSADKCELERDVSFWLGLNSTADEQGTAAYKTVELCDFFDGAPVQHREVMKHESTRFKHMFQELHYLRGGVNSGFRHVEDGGAYAARLLAVKRIHGKVHAAEVHCDRASLNQGDAFVLDAGSVIYTWYGSECSAFDKNAAVTLAGNLESARGGHARVEVAENTSDGAFWDHLGGPGDVKPASDEPVLPPPEPAAESILFRLSDSSGELRCIEVARSDLKKSMLETDSAFICDMGPQVLVWIGQSASDIVRRKALVSATEYLQFRERPLHTSVSVMREGQAFRRPFDKIFSN